MYESSASEHGAREAMDETKRQNNCQSRLSTARVRQPLPKS
jgi:hypothetical protein